MTYLLVNKDIILYQQLVVFSLENLIILIRFVLQSVKTTVTITSYKISAIDSISSIGDATAESLPLGKNLRFFFQKLRILGIKRRNVHCSASKDFSVILCYLFEE